MAGRFCAFPKNRKTKATGWRCRRGDDEAMLKFGQQIIWHGLPFGPLVGTNTFLPVEDFSLSSGVKLEGDAENGITKCTGRKLQTCGFSIRVQQVAGADPRITFELLRAMKGMSAGIYLANGVPGTLATAALDALQTSDWRKLATAQGAGEAALKLVAGTSAGNCAFMLTGVDMDARGVDAHGTIYDAVIHLSFTEDADQAQTGGLVVEMNNEDITNKIAVVQCHYETHADGAPDCLRLTFADTKDEWTSWNPKNGGRRVVADKKGKTQKADATSSKEAKADMVRVTDGALNTGKMFVHSLKPENGVYKMIAYSVPRSAYTTKSRSFETASIPTLAAKIAREHGLRCKTYGVPETAMRYLQQKGESDLAFLQRVCKANGCAFLFFDGTLCVYSEKYIESREAAYRLVPDISDRVDVVTDGAAVYSACELRNGHFTGVANDADISDGKTLRESVAAAWESQADANAAAAARLRDVNRGGKRAFMEMPTQRRLVAGSLVTLVCRGWLGKAFLYRVRHDLARKKSAIWAREPLTY